MNFETLYKRGKTGAVIQYKIEAMPEDGNHWVVQKYTGQINGAKTAHRSVVTNGKQKRNVQQQAEFEANSDWKKKRDDGYKTLADLGMRPETENASDLAAVLDKILPKFNTDASGNLKPMKAPNAPWNENTKLDWPQLFEPKMDGLRATLVANSLEDIRFLSSAGKHYEAVHHLEHEFRERYNGQYPIILDGELYCHGMGLGKINSAVKSFKESTPLINFHIFDLPLSPKEQIFRNIEASSITESLDSDLFPVLDSELIENNSMILPLHNKWVALGYEGGMLKDPNGTYQPGQRSSYWHKVKMFDDDEYQVTGFRYGERGIQDLNFVCKIKVDGTFKYFEANMMGTLADKQAMEPHIESYVGKWLTVKHFGFTEYGVPNLPKGKAFRDPE